MAVSRRRRWVKRVLIGLLGLFLLASVLPYLLPRGASAPLPEQPYDDSRITMIDGVRWHTRAGGPEGRPLVVLIHGFSGSTASWERTRPVLHGRGWRSLAIDLPAFGYSGRDPLPGDETAALWQLIEAERQGQPVALVGHSMGAGVVTWLALARPESTQGLVLVDGGPALGTPRRGRSRLVSLLLAYPPVPRWVDWYASHFLYTPEKFAELLGSAYGRTPTAAEIEAYLTPMRIEGTTEAILKRMSRAGGPLPDDADSRLNRPLTLIWGREDRWVPLAVGERAQQRLPQAELKVIEAAGHNPMETHPEAFTLLLLQALDNAIRPDFIPLPGGTPEP